MADRVRVVVAGAGAFGREHLKTLAAMPEAALAGVADVNEAAARGAAERFGAARWDSDAAALIDAVRPDGVVVATPGQTHLALARHALGLGVPVLVEKPVAMTAAEAAALAAAEAASAGFVLPGHILRFSDPHRQFAAIVRSDEIGPILSLTARRYRDDSHAARYPDIDPVLMTMIHDIDLAVWLTGAGAGEVSAMRRPTRAQRSATVLTARGATGAVWQLATAWTFPGTAPPDRIEVIGARGSVELEVGAVIRQHGAATRRIDIADGDPLRTELAAFIACIRERRRPDAVTLREAIAGLAVADAAIESLRRGAPVQTGNDGGRG
jgi:predicted dehydrogenase